MSTGETTSFVNLHSKRGFSMLLAYCRSSYYINPFFSCFLLDLHRSALEPFCIFMVLYYLCLGPCIVFVSSLKYVLLAEGIAAALPLMSVSIGFKLYTVGSMQLD